MIQSTVATGPVPFHRAAFVLLAVLVTIPAPGCISVRGLSSFHHRDPLAGAPRLSNPTTPQIEEVVAHLNQNTDRIQSWLANDVRISANHFPLSGKLAVEKGRHIRLMVSSPAGNEVDLGSNDERFWIWSKRMDPAFVTCQHVNMEAARQDLGVPFEPEWLMQALGVMSLPTANLKMEMDRSHDQARLVQQVTTAHGQPLRKVALVDLKRGIIVEHSLYDYNGHKIAQARLSGHQWDKDSGVVMPRRVILDCPQFQMSMTMDLGKIQLNPSSISGSMWEMPEMHGYQVVHLDSRLRPGVQMAARNMSHVQLDSIETEPEEEIADPSHDRFRQGRRDQFAWDEDSNSGSESEQAGHARLSDDDPVEEEFSPPVVTDDDWDKELQPTRPRHR